MNTLRDPRDGRYLALYTRDMAQCEYFRSKSAIGDIIESADRDMAQACDFVGNLCERLQLRQGARILEVGCGNGSVAVACAAAGYAVTAVDYSASRIALTSARMRDHGVTAVTLVADAARLPIAAESQHLVICKNVYEHVREQRKMLSEINRVLMVGGTCYLSVPNRYALPQLMCDEHYALPGLVLLPKTLARFYAVNLMRRDRYFILERVPSYRELCREFYRYGFSHKIWLPDLSLVRNRLLHPESIRNPKIRPFARLLQVIRLSSIMASILTSDLALSFLYPHIAFLLTKQEPASSD